MKFKPLKVLPLLLGGAVIGFLVLLQDFTRQLPQFEFFERLEWISYDWRMRRANHSPAPASDRLGFVFIGNDAISIFSEGKLGTNYQFGLYWPRHIYGRVVRELRAQGAKAVGLDILFGERRMDQDHLKAPTPNGPISSDAFFQLQLQQASNVVLGATADVIPHPVFRSAASGLGDISSDLDADGVLRRVKAFQDYRMWHLEIQHAARLNHWNLSLAQVGSNCIMFPKPDGTQAKLGITTDGFFDPSELTQTKPPGGLVRLRKAFDTVRVWHLGIVLAARELNLDLDRARVQLDRYRIILPGRNGFQRLLPVDEQGRFLIDWSLRMDDPRLAKEAFETLVADDILRELGTNITSRFQDKLVIVGSTATGNDLSDQGATPMAKHTFLTGNHWNVANSILTGRFISQSSPLTASLLVAGLGLAGAVLTLRLRTLWASAGVLLLAAAFGAIAMWAFVHQRYWMPVVLPLGSLLSTHFALLSFQAFFEQRERRRIKNVFSRIVSPNVVNELLRAEKLALVGARRELTVFFADVRGFTELTEASHAQAEAYVAEHQLSPAEAEACFDAQSQEVLQTVNLYLGTIAGIIKRHEGTLDKYIGDCVMAFWGAPTPNEHHALVCVRAAIEVQRAIEALNRHRAAENRLRAEENVQRAARGEPSLPPLILLTLGTGINTGVVTVGLMGSVDHIFNYTAFGRDVNLAARLEALSGRGRIYIGEATYRALLRDDPALAETCMELPPVTNLKGIRTPGKVYEVPWRLEKVQELPAPLPLAANG